MVHDCVFNESCLWVASSSSEMIGVAPGLWQAGRRYLGFNASQLSYGSIRAHTLNLGKIQALHPTRQGVLCSEQRVSGSEEPADIRRNPGLHWRSEACFSWTVFLLRESCSSLLLT